MSDQDDYPVEDPYNQDEFLSEEGKVKIKRDQQWPGGGTGPMTDLYEDYTTRAIWTLVAYIVFWLIGFVMNLVYLNQARNQRKLGARVDGMGCLWAVLGVFGLLPCMAIMMIVILTLLGPAIGNVFQEIQATLGSP